MLYIHQKNIAKDLFIDAENGFKFRAPYRNINIDFKKYKCFPTFLIIKTLLNGASPGKLKTPLYPRLIPTHLDFCKKFKPGIASRTLEYQFSCIRVAQNLIYPPSAHSEGFFLAMFPIVILSALGILTTVIILILRRQQHRNRNDSTISGTELTTWNQ